MINLSRMKSKLATKRQLEVPAIPLPKGMGKSERDWELSHGWGSGFKARPLVSMKR